jgi:hypothetical protein
VDALERSEAQPHFVTPEPDGTPGAAEEAPSEVDRAEVDQH